MPPEQRIAELEQEVLATRTDAINIVLGLVSGMGPSPEGRAEIAQSFEDAAADVDEVTAGLARLIAERLREG